MPWRAGGKLCYADENEYGYTDPYSEGISSIVVFNNNSDRGGVTHVLQQGVIGDLTLQRFSEKGGFVVEATAHFGSGTHNDTFEKLDKSGPTIGCRVLLGDFDGDGHNEVLTCPGGKMHGELWMYRSVHALMLNPAKHHHHVRAERGLIAPVATADMNNDGHLDAIAVEQYPQAG